MANDSLAFVKALDEFAAELRKLEAEGTTMIANATNSAAKVALKKGRELIGNEINFNKQYLANNLFISKQATAKSLEAVVTARARSTTHTRFGAKYVTEPAKSKRSRLKGRALGGISPGRKAAGLGRYTVWRGKPQQRWGSGFLINAGGNILSMYRVGPAKGDIKTLYGPSVSQAWGQVRDDVIEPAIKELKRSISEDLRK